MPYDDPDFERQLREEPTTPWEKKIRGPEFAARVLEDLEAVFRKIHDTLPEPKDALFSFGYHTSSSGRA